MPTAGPSPASLKRRSRPRIQQVRLTAWIPAGDDKHVLILLPIAPDDLALEDAAGADCHRQNIARLWDRLKLDPFAESNVTVCDGFRGLLPLAANAEGRNPEAYLDCLRHLDPDRERHADFFASVQRAPIRITRLHSGVARRVA